jgi:hypothetical protein
LSQGSKSAEPSDALDTMVVDYGGPAELVTEDTGYRLPIGSREQSVSACAVLVQLAEHPEQLPEMAARAQVRVANLFTWDVKARQTAQVYDWVLGRRRKPDFGMPLSDQPCQVVSVAADQRSESIAAVERRAEEHAAPKIHSG